MITNENDLINAVRTVALEIASDLAACMEGEPLTTEILAECAIDKIYHEVSPEFEITPKIEKKIEKSLGYYC